MLPVRCRSRIVLLCLSAQIAAWVFMWYGVSVSMVMANRWLFHEWQNVGFPFPVLTTMVHMWLKFFLSRGIFWAKVGPSLRLRTSQYDSARRTLCTQLGSRSLYPTDIHAGIPTRALYGVLECQELSYDTTCKLLETDKKYAHV